MYFIFYPNAALSRLASGIGCSNAWTSLNMHAGQYVSGRFCDFEVGVCRLVSASWQSETTVLLHPFIYTFLSVIYCKSNGIIARSRTLARSCGPLGYRGPRRVSFIRRNVQYYFPLILPVKREKKIACSSEKTAWADTVTGCFFFFLHINGFSETVQEMAVC